MQEIVEFSLSELVESIRRGDLSGEEVFSIYHDRNDSHSDLNANISLCDFEPSSESSCIKEDSPLFGVPVAVKDVILTKGIRTTAASNILKDFVAPYDATVITKLRASGASILSKTNLDEFAMGSSSENSAFGPVKNPWDVRRVPGGSSGGSAVAVSARLAPIALGTDTGGSIRQPASFCGVVGLKPTYGRVSRYGVIAYASSLDQVGVFARSVEDCALATEIISGHDPLDSTSYREEAADYRVSLGQDIKGKRIGVPREYFDVEMNSEVKDVTKKALSELEKLGATLVDISLPHTSLAVSTYYVLAPAEASSNLSRYDGVRYGHRAEEVSDLYELYSRSRSEGFGEEVKRRILIGTYVLSHGFYDAYYRQAQKVRTLIVNDFAEAFKEHCDVIASPAAPTVAFRIGEVKDPLEMYLSDVFTLPANLAGLPGISVPCGFSSEGLPVGLQLLGAPFNEAQLLQVAHAYERATCWETNPFQRNEA